MGLPEGVLINRPCPSVCVPVFRYLRDCSLFCSEILHEVGGPLSKKSDTVGVLKENLNPGIKGD